MGIINLTPHTINVIAPDGAVTEIPSTGIARVEATETDTGELIAGVPVIRQTLGEVQGLPEPSSVCPDCGETDGNPQCESCCGGVHGGVPVRYIVSRMVAAAAPTRRDLLVPARLVRDDAGRIIGCAGLEVVA